MKSILFPLLFFLALHVINAMQEKTGNIYSEIFKTSNVHDGFRAPPNISKFSLMFQKSLKILPESMLVTSVLFLINNKLGVSEEQKKKMNKVFQKVYMDITKDKQMQTISSALPYCLSDKKLNYGHYFLYLPAKITNTTNKIVFFHGYGGNFLIYIYVLKKHFKNSIIIVPSWGSSWAHGNYRYLEQVYSDVKSKFSIKIKKPALMAISAGGGAAFKYYNKNPHRFEFIVSLATCPYKKTISKMKPGLSVIMICGRYDKRFPWSGVKKRVKKLRARLNDFKLKIISDDHFFFLSSQKEWVDFVKANTKLK